MKRIVCAMLTAALLLAGCGGSPEPVQEESSLPEVVESAVLEEENVENEELAEPEGPLVLRLTVPEGYTLPRIGMALEDMGVCTAEEFVEAAQDGDYSDFPLIAALPEDERRCFTLEGYLFPATYEIYEDEAPQSIIRRMLTHAEEQITPELRSQIEAYGYTVQDIVTIASIIEKEAFGEEYMSAISSVLHNRLGVGMRLQCDVTISYVEHVIKPFITGDLDRYNDYYNTYKCAALPAGPICNPSIAAIRAAVSPADTDYLFFLTDSDQNYYFTADYDEHEDNAVLAGLRGGDDEEDA